MNLPAVGPSTPSQLQKEIGAFVSVRSLVAKIPGARAAYHSLPAFKAEQRRREQESRRLTELNERLLRDAFRGNLTVRHGPFAGMRYLAESTGSQILPKILGSYEEPIHSWIEEIISSKTYDLVIDVGCAEGYYAVGLAWRMKNARVQAFDINPQAIERTRQLAALNDVADRVSLGSECNFETFQRFGGVSTLVFCDIEGAEDVLLDPIKAPRLRDCGILIEAHDVFVEGLSDRLLTRFAKSHRVRMVMDYPGRLACYDLPDSGELSEDDKSALMDEIRLPAMRFYFLEPLPSLLAR